MIELRDMNEGDLALFFKYQCDPQAVQMAAFTAKDPSDKTAFMAHWVKIMADESIIIKTILAGGQVAGHVLVHRWFGEPEVSYWLGREHWGKGIASRALVLFLEQVIERPLFARVAKDNQASLRVLQKCKFVITGEDKGFANARGIEVEEWILQIKDETIS
jgi:RimJ/RimL family protein N-acetyltransferase